MTRADSAVELVESRADRFPIGFAHRGGALRRAEQNTLAAFRRSLAQGATGIESDVGLTADGVPVLVHPRILARPGQTVSRLRRAQLPASVPSLDDVYLACGRGIDLALDMAAPRAVDQVVATARAHAALDRLWLTYWRVDTLAGWRQRFDGVHLVYPLLFVRRRGAESRLRRLHQLGVDALNVHQRACSVATVELAHGAGLLLFAWGARTAPAARRVLATGADGVFCDDAAGMVAAVSAARRS